MSRYQQLMEAAKRAEGQGNNARIGRPGQATDFNPSAPAHGSGHRPAPGPDHDLDLNHVEDIPSADDPTIEEAGLVGRRAIERILGGRLMEERPIEGF